MFVVVTFSMAVSFLDEVGDLAKDRPKKEDADDMDDEEDEEMASTPLATSYGGIAFSQPARRPPKWDGTGTKPVCAGRRGVWEGRMRVGSAREEREGLEGECMV
jgi:hypothetical protein